MLSRSISKRLYRTSTRLLQHTTIPDLSQKYTEKPSHLAPPDANIKSLVKQFIINEVPDTTSNATETEPELNEPLTQLYSNWNLQKDKWLSLVSPINSSPYAFHSTHNSDESYTRIPRLAVTKMLVDRWCELREYYNIYAGSLEFKTTKAIELGLQHHSDLEAELHVKIDTQPLRDAIESILQERKTDSLERLVNGNTDGSSLAHQWSISIINRLFKLITTSEAREVLVHCYVDLVDNKFIENSEALKSRPVKNSEANPRRVLVSGIVDSFHLTNTENPGDLAMFEEIQAGIEFNTSSNINTVPIIDLSEFLIRVRPTINEYKDTYKLSTTDVKTRSFNRIPLQQSVLDSAKFQTIYYRKMMGILANENLDDPHFAYESLLENARLRGIDVDEPINVTTILEVLRQNFDLFYHDFVKLANGDPIGFEPFDEWASTKSFEDYNISDLIDQDAFRDTAPLGLLTIEESFKYEELFTNRLLKNWRVPPTLRYFAARSTQFYELFQNLLGDKTRVEYHNAKTGASFHTSVFKYDPQELSLQLQNGASFWNGRRLPTFTDDLDKCKYCDFKDKCVVPNKKSEYWDEKSLTGPKVIEFIHSP